MLEVQYTYARALLTAVKESGGAAAAATEPWRSTPHPAPHMDQHRSSVYTAILTVALLVALVCALGTHILIKCALKCMRRLNQGEHGGANDLEQGPCKGIEKAGRKALPTVVYRLHVDGVPQYQIQCPICLSDFKNGERIRVLPKCHHGFHIKCVDTWLCHHSSCPLCRCDILPHIPLLANHKTAPAVAAAEAAPSSPVTPAAVSASSSSSASNGAASVLPGNAAPATSAVLPPVWCWALPHFRGPLQQ